MTNSKRLTERVEHAAALLFGWHLSIKDWCILDGPAIRLHNPDFDDSVWRDHLNIYVLEDALPWQTTEREHTIPPPGSAELTELLEVGRRNVHLHLVPAARYYHAGFERAPVDLPSGYSVMAATLRGCSQVWSYKSVEVIDRADDFAGDVDRIIAERQARLVVAMTAARDGDVRDRLLLLRQGYDQLRRTKIADARMAFQQAAGAGWNSSMK